MAVSERYLVVAVIIEHAESNQGQIQNVWLRIKVKSKFNQSAPSASPRDISDLKV